MITKQTVITYECDYCGTIVETPAKPNYCWHPNVIAYDPPVVHITPTLRLPYQQHGDEPCICRKCLQRALREIADILGD